MATTAVSTKEPLAFWLVPSAESHRVFAAIIARLAGQFDAPVFEPHLTVAGGSVDLAYALSALRKARPPVSFVLSVDEMSISEQYTKSLFVRFRFSPELCDFRAALAEASELRLPAEFDPHLSLLYKEMPLAEKEELARSLELPLRQVSFASLKLVAHPPVIATREDVEAWVTRGERSLTSDPE